MTGSRASPASTTEQGIEDASKIAKQILKIPEGRRRSGGARTATHALNAGKTELVVRLTALLVGENLIGFGRFLEPVFSCLVTGIPVGMICDRNLAVRALDVVLVDTTVDAKHRVVISFGHCLALLVFVDNLVINVFRGFLVRTL